MKRLTHSDILCAIIVYGFFLFWIGVCIASCTGPIPHAKGRVLAKYYRPPVEIPAYNRECQCIKKVYTDGSWWLELEQDGVHGTIRHKVEVSKDMFTETEVGGFVDVEHGYNVPKREGW